MKPEAQSAAPTDDYYGNDPAFQFSVENEIRCPLVNPKTGKLCNRLIMRGEVTRGEIKCPSCHQFFKLVKL